MQCSGGINANVIINTAIVYFKALVVVRFPCKGIVLNPVFTKFLIRSLVKLRPIGIGPKCNQQGRKYEFQKFVHFSKGKDTNNRRDYLRLWIKKIYSLFNCLPTKGLLTNLFNFRFALVDFKLVFFSDQFTVYSFETRLK